MKNKKIFKKFFLTIFSFCHLAFFSGCQKYAQFENHNGLLSVVAHVPLYIDSAEVVPWKAHAREENDISKGVLVKFNLPNIKEKDIEELFFQRGVVSWIIKVSRRDQNSMHEDLGYFYIPNFVKRGRDQKFYPRNFSYAYFQVLYTATLMSQRLMDQNCPALKHSKQVPKIIWSPTKNDIKEEDGKKYHVWAIVPTEKMSVSVKRIELLPVAFDGSNTLIGDYYVDLALYNLKEGQRYSDYARVGAFRIEQEKELVPITCVPTDHRRNPIRPSQFKFGHQ